MLLAPTLLLRLMATWRPGCIEDLDHRSSPTNKARRPEQDLVDGSMYVGFLGGIPPVEKAHVATKMLKGPLKGVMSSNGGIPKSPTLRTNTKGPNPKP